MQPIRIPAQATAAPAGAPSPAGRTFRGALAALAAAALLAGCGGAAAPAPTAPPATQPAAPTELPAPTQLPAAPTAAPAPSRPPAATAAPTPTAAPAPTLPAPLYILAAGQLVRVAPEDLSVAPVAGSAELPVRAFDIAPGGARIAFLAGEAPAAQLTLAAPDGTSATVLLEGALAVPRWAPSGAQLAVRIDSQAGPDAAGPSGVFLVPAAGGAPQLLQTDDPPLDPSQPAQIAGLAFEPLAWSPDGARLLMATFIPDADYCGMAVRDLAAGTLTMIAPGGGLTDCGNATWSADGSSIIMTVQSAGASAARLPGLWRADPATGAVAPLLPETLDGDPALYLGARQLADGLLYTLIARAPAFDPLAYPPQPLEYGMYRAPADGSAPPEPVRADTHQAYDARWAPDGSGVAAIVQSAGEDPDAVRVLWIPADGSPPVDLLVQAALALAWG